MKLYVLVGDDDAARLAYKSALLKFHSRFGWQVLSSQADVEGSMKRWVSMRVPVIVDCPHYGEKAARAGLLASVPDTWDKRIATFGSVPQKPSEAEGFKTVITR